MHYSQKNILQGNRRKREEKRENQKSITNTISHMAVVRNACTRSPPAIEKRERREENKENRSSGSK
jgi:hypothetical protein